ncbi:MAG: hypothetical protein GY759_18625 [Chloroflexi bacterium]|nr:hypothetical protein [Chloroflexota bacterium]
MELFVNLITYAGVALLFVSMVATLSISKRNGRTLSLASILMKPFSGLNPPTPVADAEPQQSEDADPII